jgi:hypothetical protein
MQQANPELQEHFFEAIKEQIRTKTPPETKETFERLCAEGCSEEDAYRLLACVLSAEMYAVLKEGRPYNNTRYVNNLKKLPTLPWE